MCIRDRRSAVRSLHGLSRLYRSTTSEGGGLERQRLRPQLVRTPKCREVKASQPTHSAPNQYANGTPGRPITDRYPPPETRHHPGTRSRNSQLGPLAKTGLTQDGRRCDPILGARNQQKAAEYRKDTVEYRAVPWTTVSTGRILRTVPGEYYEVTKKLP